MPLRRDDACHQGSHLDEIRRTVCDRMTENVTMPTSDGSALVAVTFGGNIIRTGADCALEYNPSVGLVLKFTGDAVTLVLIRGSNLDMHVNGAVNLTEWGLQQHRIVWVKEMDDD